MSGQAAAVAAVAEGEAAAEEVEAAAVAWVRCGKTQHGNHHGLAQCTLGKRCCPKSTH